MKTKKLSVALLCTFLFGSGLYAQTISDSLPSGYKRNVIKWNLTPFLLWSRDNVNISYERVIGPHRSFSVNAGYFVFPSFGSYDSLQIESARNKSGFSFSGDYRFYFKNRNAHNAPDGVYWGPYGSVHHYEFVNDFSIDTPSGSSGNLSFDGNFNIVSLGVQLGYQFVIKERLTVDLIFMGPSFSYYSAKLKLDGEIDINEEDEYLQAIRDALVSKFPFLDDLLKDKEFNENGVTTALGPGMRYMIQLGYTF